MTGLYLLLVLAAIFVVFVAPALALIGFLRGRRHQMEIYKLQRRLDLLEARAEFPHPVEPAAQRSADEVVASPRPEPDVAESVAEISAPAPADVPDQPRTEIVARGESVLAGRWLVWVGALALALGGVFLIRYSIEQGLLGPRVRVLAATAFGLALVGLGERARRRPFAPASALFKEATIPPALTGAGLVTLYAAAYGAHGLYHLIAPVAAFTFLAAISFAALVLALRQGPAIGALGLVGGYLVPLLVVAGEPNRAVLLAYVAAVSGACLGLVALKRWWWLGWTAVIGAAFWGYLAISTVTPGLSGAEAGAIVAFTLLLGLGFAGVLSLETVDLTRPTMAVAVGGTGLIVAALLSAAFVAFSDYSPVATLSALGLLALYLLAGHQSRAIAGAGFAGFVMASVVLWLWPLEGASGRGEVIAAESFARVLPALPPLAQTFAEWALLAGTLYIGFGVAGLFRQRSPDIAAINAGLLPPILLALVYWRLRNLGADLGWGVVAGLLAAFTASLTDLIRRRFAKDGQDLPMDERALAALVLGALASLSLAFVMTLKEAWLTVALALQLPAIAFVYSRLRLPGLRIAAMLVTGICLVRLVFNPYVAAYPVPTENLLFNWAWYGYGVPALSFWAASRLFRETDNLVLARILRSGALTFLTLLVTIEIRFFTTNGALLGGYSLLNAALNSAAWLSLSLTLYRHGLAKSDPVSNVAARVLFWLAVANIGLVHGLVRNPWLTGDSIEPVPLLNVLTLAYLVPALFLAAFAAVSNAQQPDRRIAPRAFLILSAVGLGLAYLTMEVWHIFHLTGGHARPTEDGELYAYSLAWLLYAAGLLVAGLWRGHRLLRQTALVLLVLTTAKVFIVDMSGLEGILRVMSFMGLGASLLGIGFLYQRFVTTEGTP